MGGWRFAGRASLCPIRLSTSCSGSVTLPSSRTSASARFLPGSRNSKTANRALIPFRMDHDDQATGILKNRARRTVCRSRRRFDSRMSCTALFRWIELNYGLFQAFGAVGALLLVAAAICAALAVSSVKRGPRQFPSLTSRLRVAIASNPLHSDQNPTAENIPSAVLFAACGKVR
jgi:hypothetical protein